MDLFTITNYLCFPQSVMLWMNRNTTPEGAKFAHSPFQDDAEGSYYVHTFREESLGQYHGKHITRARFHPQTPTSDLPDKRLCEWHYTQCILQNLRGFGCSPPIAP